MAPLPHRQHTTSGRGAHQAAPSISQHYVPGRQFLPAGSAPLVLRTPVSSTVQSNAQSTYSGITNTIRQASLEGRVSVRQEMLSLAFSDVP